MGPATGDLGRMQMSAYEQIRTVTRLSTALLVALFCGVVGLLYDNRVLIAVAEALAALLALSWLYVRVGAAGLDAVRLHAGRCSEDDGIPVRIRIRNRLGLPLADVEVRDWFAPDFLPLKRILVPSVPAAGEAEAAYEGRCEQGRGRFEVGPIDVSVSDPLGFFRRLRTLDVRTPLVVLPRPFPIRDLRLQEAQVRMPVSAPEVARAGQAATFLGTREYRPGDNTRHLHWPSTARWGRLVLKEFEADTNLDLTVFVDASQASLRGVGRGSTVDYAVRVAASVADHALTRLYAVRLIADGGAPIVLPARSGAVQRAVVLETLALLRASGRLPYAQLVSQGLRMVPEGSAVALIFNGTDEPDDALAGLLGILRRRAVRVLSVVLDADTFAAMERGPAAGRPGRIVDALRRLGLEPLVIRSGEDPASAFARPRPTEAAR